MTISNKKVKEVHASAPAPCPVCGVMLKVLLTRNPMRDTCPHCRNEIITMAVGIVNTSEEKLKYMVDELRMWVGVLNSEYNEKKEIS